MALRRLQVAGLKRTDARKMILEMLTREHGPFSVEEIFDRLHDSQCNLVTVYRTLASLEEVGLVRRYDIGDRISRYEYRCAEHPHHHLICSACKKVEVIDNDILASLSEVAKLRGFARLHESVDIFGICQNCQK